MEAERSSVTIYHVDPDVPRIGCRCRRISRTPTNLAKNYEVIFVLGGFQTAFALVIGVIFAVEANSNPRGQSELQIGDISEKVKFDSMGSFLASRAMDNESYANVIFWTVARSVFLSWSMWIAVWIVVLLSMQFTNHWPASMMPPGIGAWYMPLTFLSSWICMTNAASTAFFGQRAAKFVVVTIAMSIGYLILIGSIQAPREVD